MDPITGGLIAGGASLLGNLFGTQQNNQMQLQLQQQQQAYNTQMSNTAYSRASADMKNAGLNPMMMFGSGSAASSPVSPGANLESPIKASVAPAIDKAVSTAVQMKTVDKMAQEISNLQASQLMTKAQTRSEMMRPELIAEETYKTRGDVALRKAALPAALNEALTAENLRDMNPTIRKLLDVAGFSGRSISNATSPIANLVSSARQGMNMFGHGY